MWHLYSDKQVNRLDSIYIQEGPCVRMWSIESNTKSGAPSPPYMLHLLHWPLVWPHSAIWWRYRQPRRVPSPATAPGHRSSGHSLASRASNEGSPRIHNQGAEGPIQGPSLNSMHLIVLTHRGGHSGGAGGAQATPGILIFQKQVTLFTKSGDTLELEWRHTASKVNKFKPITFPSYLQP